MVMGVMLVDSLFVALGVTGAETLSADEKILFSDNLVVQFRILLRFRSVG